MNTNHLSANTTSKSIESLLKSRLLASAAALAALIAGVATTSVPLLVLGGIFAYGWPLLHAGFTKLNENSTAKSPKSIAANASAVH